MLRKLFGLDLRSVAAFRIAVAVVVLGDLAARATDIDAFYTDGGVLPRRDLLESFGFLHDWPICLHLMSGSYWGEVALFALTGVAALALLAGYRSRLACAACWLLMLSLQLRNLYVGHGSDAQVRLALLWGCFLPLGARWSLDRSLFGARTPTANQYLSVGAVALTAQLVIMYLATGHAKSLLPYWRDGTAVTWVFDDELFGTTFGLWARHLPWLCAALTYLTLILELAGPLLLFLPVGNGPVRTFTVLGLMAMHIGFSVGLRVGVFPYVSIACLVALLPGWFWDRLVPSLRGASRNVAPALAGGQNPSPARGPRLQAYSSRREDRVRDDRQSLEKGRANEGRRGMLWRALATVQRRLDEWLALQPRPETPVDLERRNPWRESICAILLGFTLIWNYGVWRDPAYVAPTWLAWIGNPLFMQQDWRMFANVSMRTGWVVVPGQLRDGTEVDLFKLGGPVPDLDDFVPGGGASFEKPVSPRYRVKNYRWLGMMSRLVYRKRGEEQLLNYGRYLCRNWNIRHAGNQQLENLQIVFMARPTRPEPWDAPQSAYEREVLWQHGCFR